MSSALSRDAIAGFSSLGLHDALVATVTEMGFTAPTPIQEQAIGPLLAGHDVLGQAATGTGKTAAFGLPMVQLIAANRGRDGAPRGLVLVPTRELAMQVARALDGFAAPWKLDVLAVYGGQPISTQLRALRRGVDIVVATPGRALDLVNRRALRLDAVAHVVLDEADEMLDMGFAEDLDAIFVSVPEERQSALFSATLPPRIADMAKKHLQEPVRIKIAAPKAAAGAPPRVEQRVYFVPVRHKAEALARLLEVDDPKSTIIFCRTRQDVDALSSKLTSLGYRGDPLHGGLSQEQRDRVMRRFRDGTTTLLIATDVAARGLDIDHVSHVVNYDVPGNAEVYVHRIGRTGRAGRSGVAITFAQPKDRRLLRAIENLGKAPLTPTPVPGAAEVRARRIEKTRVKVAEAMQGAGKERFRAVAESLATNGTLLDVACAALELLHGDVDLSDLDIPAADAKPARDNAKRTAPARQVQNRRRDTRGGWEVASLFVGAGHESGVRARDLVGCIANELDLDARAIGAIQIGPRFSLVEVPEEIADDIVAGLRGATIKGKRVTIRRDRGRAQE